MFGFLELIGTLFAKLDLLPGFTDEETEVQRTNVPRPGGLAHSCLLHDKHQPTLG